MSYFDRLYAGGEGIYGEAPDDFLVANLPLEGVRTALDAGGGEGRHALWLAQHGVEVELIDTSPEAVGRSTARADEAGLPVHAEIADLRGWEAERRYDLVIAAIVLHAFEIARAAEVAERLRRSVAPGGYFYLSVHLGGSAEERMRREAHQEERAQRTFFSEGHIKTLFSEEETRAMAGWEPIAIERSEDERCPRATCPYPHDVLRILARCPYTD